MQCDSRNGRYLMSVRSEKKKSTMKEVGGVGRVLTSFQLSGVPDMVHNSSGTCFT